MILRRRLEQRKAAGLIRLLLTDAKLADVDDGAELPFQMHGDDQFRRARMTGMDKRTPLAAAQAGNEAKITLDARVLLRLLDVQAELREMQLILQFDQPGPGSGATLWVEDFDTEIEAGGASDGGKGLLHGGV